MEYSQQIQGNTLSLTFSGEMTFNDNPKVREVIGIIEKNKIGTLAIDFSRVTFIDSAGLGMLLILKEELAKNKGLVLLQHAQGQVEKMFKVSKFDALFDVK